MCASKDSLDGLTGSTRTSMTSPLKSGVTQMRVILITMDLFKSRKSKLSPGLTFSKLRGRLLKILLIRKLAFLQAIFRLTPQSKASAEFLQWLRVMEKLGTQKAESRRF